IDPLERTALAGPVQGNEITQRDIESGSERGTDDGSHRVVTFDGWIAFILWEERHDVRLPLKSQVVVEHVSYEWIRCWTVVDVSAKVIVGWYGYAQIDSDERALGGAHSWSKCEASDEQQEKEP